MDISRRGFIGSVAAAGLARAWAADAKPLLRFGLMTDTHVHKTVGSCGRVKLALELFRARGCELVINNGDIADRFYPDGYKAYRQVFDAVYAGARKPQEIYAYAWHDCCEYKPGKRGAELAPAAFEEVRRLLAAPHPHTAEIVLNGFTFLVMPQFTGCPGFLSWTEYEQRVAAACRANPGKPVFVVDHVPPRGTVFNSVNWGCRQAREILDRYPQVVNLSGHVHGSLRNDRFIWQDTFTVINAGCLQSWAGVYMGQNAVRQTKTEFGVLTVDVFADRLVARRWDVRDRREIDPGRVWTVPFPFVPAAAPYRMEKRRAAEPVPAFPADARVTAAPALSPAGAFNGVTVTFPDTAPHTMWYRVSAARADAAGRAAAPAVFEQFSQYHLRAQDRKPALALTLPAVCFEPSAPYRVEVTPLNQYGVAGAPVGTDTVTPAFPARRVLWECADPAAALMFEPSYKSPGDAPFKPDADGFFGPLPVENARLVLPPDIFPAAEPGTRLFLLADVHTVTDSFEQQPTLKLAPKNGVGGFCKGEYTGFGSVRSRRALELTAKDTPCDLEVWACRNGKVRFHALRLVAVT